jgi:hypothetical protein
MVMKTITISFGIVDDCIKQIVFDENETDMPNNSETLEMLAFTLLTVISKEKDSMKVQDVLNELNIKRQ